MKSITISILSVSIVLLGFCQAAGQADRPPYISPVSKFTFAETPAEQEQQLKTNPLMLRFAESRKRLASDPYRPLYHFVSPESNPFTGSGK